MRGENARRDGIDLPDVDRSDLFEASAAATAEHDEAVKTEVIRNAGDKVDVFIGSSEYNKHIPGEIKSFEDGIYTVEVGGEKMNFTESQLQQHELKNALLMEMSFSLVSANEKGGVSADKLYRMESDLFALVNELVVWGNESKDTLKDKVNGVIQDMLTRPEGEEGTPAWLAILENISPRQEAIKTELTALDYEPEDVEKVIAEIGESTEALAKAKMGGDAVAAAENGADLFETSGEVSLQLKEELETASPDTKMQLSDALGKFDSPLSLGARGVQEVSPELAEQMDEASRELSKAPKPGMFAGLQKRFGGIFDSFKKGFSDFKNARVAAKREEPRADKQPHDAAGEFMPDESGDVEISDKPDASGKVKRRSPQSTRRATPKPISAGYGVNVGGMPKTNRAPDYRGMTDSGTYSPEQKIEAGHNAIAELGTDSRVNRVAEFMSSESGRLAAEGDPSLESLKGITPDDYKEQQDLAAAGGFAAKRAANKELARMDALMLKAERMMESVGKAPIGGVDTPQAIGAGYSANMGGMPKTNKAPDYKGMTGGTYSPEQKMEAGHVAVAELGIDSRVNRVADFMSSESGRLATLGDSSLEALVGITTDDYKEQQDLAIAGGFFARRGARKKVKQMDALMLKAERMMESVGTAPIGGVDTPQAIGAGYSANMGGMPEARRGPLKIDRSADAEYGDANAPLFDENQTFDDDPTGELIPSDGKKSVPQRVRPGQARRAGVSIPTAGYGVPIGGRQPGGLEPRYRSRVRPDEGGDSNAPLFDADQKFGDKAPPRPRRRRRARENRPKTAEEKRLLNNDEGPTAA